MKKQLTREERRQRREMVRGGLIFGACILIALTAEGWADWLVGWCWDDVPGLPRLRGPSGPRRGLRLPGQKSAAPVVTTPRTAKKNHYTPIIRVEKGDVKREPI